MTDMERIFPPVEEADEDGLLLVGGEYSTRWLVEAYRSGVFPWPYLENNLETLCWWSPDPRAVLPLERFYVSRRLRRRIRRGEFHLTCDRAFAEVIESCAQPRYPGDGAWITPSLAKAYQQLHQEGWAHSIEAWRDGQLAGGVYGVSMGGMFAAESMFHRVRDASNVALAALAHHLAHRGFVLLDIQILTTHTEQLGGRLIPRSRFLFQLEEALAMPVSFGQQLIWPP